MMMHTMIMLVVAVVAMMKRMKAIVADVRITTINRGNMRIIQLMMC